MSQTGPVCCVEMDRERVMSEDIASINVLAKQKVFSNAWNTVHWACAPRGCTTESSLGQRHHGRNGGGARSTTLEHAPRASLHFKAGLVAVSVASPRWEAMIRLATALNQSLRRSELCSWNMAIRSTTTESPNTVKLTRAHTAAADEAQEALIWGTRTDRHTHRERSKQEPTRSPSRDQEERVLPMPRVSL